MSFPTSPPDQPDPSPAPALQTLRFNIEGRVQGVGFRWWARSVALDLGLVGTVRNLADGSVELIAAGEPDALQRLTRALHDGPPPATVTNVTSAPAPAMQATTFEIVR